MQKSLAEKYRKTVIEDTYGKLIMDNEEREQYKRKRIIDE
jgi:hypothetical protein